MSVLRAIAHQVGLDQLTPRVQRTPYLRTEERAWSKPLLQFVPLPVTLDVARYRGALSTSHPDGDARAAYAFAQLVDPLPSWGETYNAGLGSTEKIYGQLVRGAQASTDNAFAQQVCREARLQYEKAARGKMDGTPDDWRPVEAVPADWTELEVPGRYRELSVDLQANLEGESPFALPGEQRALGLALGGGAAVALDPATRLKSLKLRYLLVQLRRPWLSSLLFETSGWRLMGQKDGYCSSGTLEANAGVLPLLPTAVLLATDVTLEASWGPNDEKLLAVSRARNAAASLGPLPLGCHAADVAGRSVQVMAWLSTVVPLSPKASGRTDGAIVVENKGGFVVRFALEWTRGGVVSTRTSAALPVLAAEKLTIPADASQASLTVELMTCPPPFETWKVVTTRSVEPSANKRFVVSGTTGHSHVEEQAP